MEPPREASTLRGPHSSQFEVMAAAKEIAPAFPGLLERQAAQLRTAALRAAGGAGAERLAEDLRGFARKCYGIQRHVTSTERAAAGERGLRVLLGHPREAVEPESAAYGKAGCAWSKRGLEPADLTVRA